MKFATVKVFDSEKASWRFIDCAVVWQDENRCGLQVPGAEGVWTFENGFCSQDFYGINPAKIDRWLDAGEEPAERDRFEDVTQENTPADMWRYLMGS